MGSLGFITISLKSVTNCHPEISKRCSSAVAFGAQLRKNVSGYGGQSPGGLGYYYLYLSGGKIEIRESPDFLPRKY
jgi:hypothetical protein